MKQLILGALACALLLSGCQPGGSSKDIAELKQLVQATQADVKSIKDTLDRITKPRQGPPPEDFNKIYDIPVGDSPILGKADAPVALVEFSDFQCPYCARVQPDLKALLQKYPDKVKLVFKHFPLDFHQQARPAAIATMAAQEQGKFWEMHDLLFQNQAALDPAKFEEYAKQAGLDVARFKKDYEAKKAEYDKRVTSDIQLGSQSGVMGTPSLYIGGKKVQNRSVDGMSAMVEEALKRAGSS
jgi:protein-disulfide isomerase